jgi:hypothetical protein
MNRFGIGTWAVESSGLFTGPRGGPETENGEPQLQLRPPYPRLA